MKNLSTKKSGNRRSKLEIILEDHIRIHYPTLELMCNDRTTAHGLELDFYFPAIKLAIELNGIFHYEPVFGEEKLNRIQERDCRKFLTCYRNNIALAIVDSSSVKYITESVLEKYSLIFDSIIEKHLAAI